MTVKARIAIVTGKYTAKDGTEKNSYVDAGHIHAGEYRDYGTLGVAVVFGVALAAMLRGEERLMFSMFDSTERGQGATAQTRESGEAPRPAKASPPAKGGKTTDLPFDDPIPF